MLIGLGLIVPATSPRPEVVKREVAGYALPMGMSVQTYALRYYSATGGTKAQFGCLKRLWTRESHWNYKARNPRGGAYGIPQAYPAKKMARFGSDWRTNPAVQIQWGLNYIRVRYGNDACAALKHHIRRGFY